MIKKDKSFLIKFNRLYFVMIFFIAFVVCNFYLIGALLLLFSFLLCFLFYRCPNCNKELDLRLKLEEHVYGPYCGKEIK